MTRPTRRRGGSVNYNVWTEPPLVARGKVSSLVGKPPRVRVANLRMRPFRYGRYGVLPEVLIDAVAQTNGPVCVDYMDNRASLKDMHTARAKERSTRLC